MISNQEILNRFDVLYNNIMSNQAPGLDDYEKSVFWNKAQLEVLKNHLNPKGNKYGEGFDHSSKRQIDFSSLTNTVTYIFPLDDIEGSFNNKALRCYGDEKVIKDEVTRYSVIKKYEGEDEDGEPEYSYTITPYTEIVEQAVITKKDWPNDLLSIVNESLDVLNVSDWKTFAYYMSEMVYIEFDPTDPRFISIVTSFIDWGNTNGFPKIVELLSDAISIWLHYVELVDGKYVCKLTPQEIFAGIGFGQTKPYNEAMSDVNVSTDTIPVVPLNNVDYDTIMSRPYKYPSKSQAWRILTNGEPEFLVSPQYHPVRYRLRYVKTPAEVNLASNVSPEIPEVLIDEVLQRAVELAKNSWEGNLETTKALGERSE